MPETGWYRNIDAIVFSYISSLVAIFLLLTVLYREFFVWLFNAR